MFNTKLITYLESENKRKDERIDQLLSLLVEAFEVKVFKKTPERLTPVDHADQGAANPFLAALEEANKDTDD